MTKGRGGGIRLLPDFVLEKSLFSHQEQDEILYALQSLAVTGGLQDKTVLSRMRVLFQRTPADWIDVDFSGWGHGPQEREKFLRIKQGGFGKPGAFLYLLQYLRPNHKPPD